MTELLAPLASSELLSLLPTWRESTQSHMYVRPVLTPEASDTAEFDAVVLPPLAARRKSISGGWGAFRLVGCVICCTFSHMTRVYILDQESEWIIELN